MLATILAAPLLVGAEVGLAQEEPAARAPLPPPLPPAGSTPAVPQNQATGLGSASQHAQSDADPPTIRFDRSLARPQAKPAIPETAPHSVAVAPVPRPAARPRNVAAKKSASHHRPARGLTADTGAARSQPPPTPGAGRSQLPPAPSTGYLSPPEEYRGSGLESAATAPPGPPQTAPPGPPQTAPLYYRSPPAPPLYGYAPGYPPYPWPPPAPGFYR